MVDDEDEHHNSWDFPTCTVYYGDEGDDDEDTYLFFQHILVVTIDWHN